jgi:hypothetical protein
LGGHSTGAPLAQKKVAGQGTQVSCLITLLPYSAVTSAPVGAAAIKMGKFSAAAAPKPSAYPAAPLPAIVRTLALARSIARTL